MVKILKLVFIAGFTGLASGALSSAFLHLLGHVTDLRSSNQHLIWGLPVFGLFLSFVMKRIPTHINQGVPYLIHELGNEKAPLSPWMAPFVFLSSLGTHLFGGSAGREGVGVIMGASIAHLIPKFGSHFQNLRKFLIYGGIAAGFSSIFGTPFAAIVFAFELHAFKHIKRVDLLICTTLASFSAFFVSHFLGPAHQHFSVSLQINEVMPYILIAGFVSGGGAQIYYWSYRAYSAVISKLLPHLSLRLTIGALLISTLVYLTKSFDYIGIGTHMIAQSFESEMSYSDFALKALLTIMTLTIGFKGGEVTPLFFMGATLSNWASALLNFRNYALSSSLGMVAMFGALTATPIASALMGAELFGWRVGVCCLVSCMMARFLMRKRSVYRS